MTTPCEWTQKKCLPCEGGVDPLTIDDAKTHLAELEGWELNESDPARARIKKQWRVKNFLAAMDFFQRCTELAEDEGHHPDLHVVGYRNVTVELWTHAIGGLSDNDFIVAAKIDQLPIELAE